MDGVEATALITTGEAAENGYRMVGIPDGLGAFMDGGMITLLMNHELTNTSGVVRAHGSIGAFVSRWTIDPSTMRVVAGSDFEQSPNSVHLWDAAARRYTQGTFAMSRHCSADLPVESALRFGNLGTSDRIFLNGEEFSDGRAWARIATGPNAGETWQLPRLGRLNFENVVASPQGREKTIIALTDDGNLNTAPVAADFPSEVYIYVGTKQAQGSPIERAGLTNGKLYGVRVYRDGALVNEESNEFGLGDNGTGYMAAGSFDLVELGANGDVSALTPLPFQENAIARDVYRFQRPEDSAWDPRGDAGGDLYFVTTASVTTNSRLWRLRFSDLNRPELGGTIEILLNATPGRMFDNITIDQHGRLLLQEDTGNDPRVSRIWLYGIDTGEFMQVAHHNPELFEPNLTPSRFITQDEESSGIIDVEHLLGPGWFLFDVQVHKLSDDPELVEGGQLVALYVPPELGRA
jgi:hypothetical protein